MGPVLAVALVALVSACGRTPGTVHAAATTTPATFEVTGAMLVTPDYRQLWRDAGGKTDGASIEGKGCRGGRGYDDITAGSQVAVRDGGGKVVAVGQLNAGIARTIKGGGMANCSFALTVPGVPTGSTFYSVEVAHRGQVQFTATAIRQPLSLNLK